ncbi:hypothetical protein B5F27_05770 [Faecalibacterium sp. An192]|nr:hypothetical protein B5F27_05770 [Faecalibacterium sp. An192]
MKIAIQRRQNDAGMVLKVYLLKKIYSLENAKEGMFFHRKRETGGKCAARRLYFIFCPNVVQYTQHQRRDTP